MRVKFKATAAGPNGNYSVGQVADVDDAWGGNLCQLGFAEAMDAPAPVEAATVPSDGVETAAETKPVRRKKKASAKSEG